VHVPQIDRCLENLGGVEKGFDQKLFLAHQL
jgi:hypothetical protein